MSEKTAVVLAGGMGTRLRPYTIVLPKPLMPIGDYPILEVIMRQLSHYGFKRVILTVNHQADIIKAFCNDGSKWGLRIEYSMEEKALSTMGPLSLIKDLPENFLVMNGDILSDVDFGAFHDDHVNSNALFSISSFLRETVNLYGVLDKDENDLLTNFREKPVTSFEVSMGVYMANRKILDHIPHNESYGFDKLMLDLLKQKKGVRVKRFNGYWLDIGRPDDYMQAIEEFESRKSSFLPPSNDKK